MDVGQHPRQERVVCVVVRSGLNPANAPRFFVMLVDGVLGVLPGIVGTIQATEILKLALGKGASLVGRLLLFNALDMKFRELKLRRDPECPVCGKNPTITELIDYEQFCGISPEPETPAVNPDEVSVQEMKRALEQPKLGIRVIDADDVTARDLLKRGVAERVGV